MTNVLRNFSFIVALFASWHVIAMDNLEIADTPSVDGLSAEATSGDVKLLWPSSPQETFAVLWRSNASYQTPWVALTSKLHAAPRSNRTVFVDVGGLKRLRTTGTNLLGFYAVYLVPDFWFAMDGTTLSGGPTMPREDFLPFYYGIKGTGFPRPEVGLMVDGEEAGWGPIRIERVNFGSVENPRWTFAPGFWVRLDLLGNGEHSLQLTSTLSLNNFIGDWTQDIKLTNRPIRVRVSMKQQNTIRLSWWNRRLGFGLIAPQTAEDYERQDRNLSESQIPSRPLFLNNNSNMSLELGLTQNFIQVTPEYSNAVLEVLLPYFSEFARKLNLPVPRSITKSDVADCRILPHRNGDEVPGTIIKTTQGWSFSFDLGHVNSFRRPSKETQRPTTAKITTAQAIKSARNCIKQAGISLDDAFAEQEPRVTLKTVGRNPGDHYLVEWYDPRGTGPSVTRIEVNCQTGQVESLYLNAQNLRRPSPKVSVIPPRGHGAFDSKIPPPVNPEYAWKLIPLMLKAIDDYTRKLSLPIPRPLTTNNISDIEVHNNNGWPHSEIVLTNGWRFIYRHCMVNGYFAPDNFFDSDNRRIHIREFEGKWNLTTNQAIAAIKSAISKLNYPTNQVHMDSAPAVFAAAVNQSHIPRLHFEWLFAIQDELQSKLEAEVNADSGKLESLYYDDKAYWGCRPPIDVPISTNRPLHLPPASDPGAAN